MLERLQSRKFLLALVAAAALWQQKQYNEAVTVVLAYLGIEGTLDFKNLEFTDEPEGGVVDAEYTERHTEEIEDPEWEEGWTTPHAPDDFGEDDLIPKHVTIGGSMIGFRGPQA